VANQFFISTGATTMVANTAKTVIEMPTGATMDATVIGLEISSMATAAGTLIVEIGTFATTGTGTTVTPARWGLGAVAAIMGTCKINNTAEPGTVTVLYSFVIPLPGMYSVREVFAREFYRPVSTNTLIRLTSSLAVASRTNVIFEQ
jgi:hypothetical protein